MSDRRELGARCDSDEIRWAFSVLKRRIAQPTVSAMLALVGGVCREKVLAILDFQGAVAQYGIVFIDIVSEKS